MLINMKNENNAVDGQLFHMFAFFKKLFAYISKTAILI